MKFFPASLSKFFDKIPFVPKKARVLSYDEVAASIIFDENLQQIYNGLLNDHTEFRDFSVI